MLLLVSSGFKKYKFCWQKDKHHNKSLLAVVKSISPLLAWGQIWHDTISTVGNVYIANSLFCVPSWLMPHTTNVIYGKGLCTFRCFVAGIPEWQLGFCLVVCIINVRIFSVSAHTSVCSGGQNKHLCFGYILLTCVFNLAYCLSIEAALDFHF